VAAALLPVAAGLLVRADPAPEVLPAFAPKKSAWERSVGGPQAAQRLIRARLEGWPTRYRVDPAELPQDDREFLWRVARDTWKGLTAFRNVENGLPMDHVRFAPGSVDPERAHVADYTSITSVGLYVASIVAARDLGFIGTEEAIARLRLALETVRDLETWGSMYFNYYDTTSLERTSEFLSFVDSSWLTAGAMVVRQAFPELTGELDARIRARNHRFFYDSDLELMSHGYYVDRRIESPYRYGFLYTEARLGSLIAIGKGDVPPEHWFRMMRTPARSWDHGRKPIGLRTKRLANWYRVVGGWYEWQGLRFVPSWGGSMFEALMPTLLLDERSLAPKNLGRNDAVHVEIQRRYALETLGYPVWGLSPAMTPGGVEHYGEYGVPLLGAHGYPDGVVTPHAAALALPFEPAAATANLRRLAELYPIYGEYGFYDSVDPKTGEVAPVYMTLDQTMLFLALANTLRDGVIQKRFAADPIAAAAIPLLSLEDFFD
jgi:hypothetical protein